MKNGHTEQWRAQRFYIVAIVRHRGTVGAWRNRGYLRVLVMLLSTSLQSSGLQDFLKRLLPKLSVIRTLYLCRSLCLRHLRDIVCFHLRALPLSVCLLYVVGLLYYSIFRKNQIKICLSISMSFVFYKQFILLSIDICKLFSCNSKPIHALLASKRHLIDLQKMPFWSVTNALLKSN